MQFLPVRSCGCGEVIEDVGRRTGMINLESCAAALADKIEGGACEDADALVPRRVVDRIFSCELETAICVAPIEATRPLGRGIPN